MDNIREYLRDFRNRERIGIEIIDSNLYNEFQNAEEHRTDLCARMMILQINIQDLVGDLNEMVCAKDFCNVVKRRLTRDDYTYVTFYVNWPKEDIEKIKEIAEDYVLLIK